MSTSQEVPKGRIAQLRQAYRITKQTDKAIGFILLGTFLAGAAVGAGVSWILLQSINEIFAIFSMVLLGLSTGLLAMLLVFGRRAEHAAYAQVEGQVGAAAGAMQMLRRGWFVAPAVGFTKQQDVVHRAVGRAGIVLVGEGNPNRVRNLLAVEKKKHARIAGEIPIIDIVVGNEPGEVPLPRLLKYLKKLPKAMKPAELTALMSKIKALDAMRPVAPVPRGPLPTSTKGARKMMQGR